MLDLLRLLTTVKVTVGQALVAISKPKLELDSYADTCVVGHYCLVIQDHEKAINVFSYNLNNVLSAPEQSMQQYAMMSTL